MVVEWLKFEVAKADQAVFLHYDELIWTRALERYDGFIQKQVWLEGDNTVICVIWWAHRQLWKQIPPDDLTAIEEEWGRALGSIPYNLVEVKEFEVI